MSDPVIPVVPAVVTPVVETPPVVTPVEPADLSAEVEKWKALSRKNEERATENAEKAKRLDGIEDANRTELEKANARADAAEKVAATATAAALRSEVATTKGVPAGLLSGSTREELEASADGLLAFKGAPVVTPAAPSALGQGNEGIPIPGSDDGYDAAIAAATAARNFPLAITLKQQKAAKKG